MRLILPAILLALPGCDGADDETACCAIESLAKCERALHGIGVSKTEQAVLLGPHPVCPTENISLARMRELDARWPQACREAGLSAPQPDARRC